MERDFNDQIAEVISLQISSAFFDEGSPEIAIANYTLQAFNHTGFAIQVDFAQPAYIT